MQLRDDYNPYYYVISAADDADVVILNVGDRVDIRIRTDPDGHIVPAGTIITAYQLDILP